MKTHSHKVAGHDHQRRIGSGIYGQGLGHYDSPYYVPYYTYPLRVIRLPETSPVYDQQRAPLMWTYHLLQDKFSQLAPVTEINIAAGSYWISKA